MRFIVRSRRLLSALDLTERHVLISVSDPPPWPPEAAAPDAPNRATLRLQFEDVSRPGERSMTDAHADEIAAFIAAHADVAVVVTSCTAGGSRSPSMAFALADALKIPRNQIDWDGLTTNVHAPNTWVYDRTREAMARYLKSIEFLYPLSSSL